MLRRQVFGACAPAPAFALLPLVPDLLLPDSVPALTSTPSRALFVFVCVALSLSAPAFFSCVRTQTPLANLKNACGKLFPPTQSESQSAWQEWLESSGHPSSIPPSLRGPNP